MRFKIQLIKLLTATAVTVIACAFATLYGMITVLTLQRGIPLPAITDVIFHHSKWAYLFPAAVLISGILLLRRGDTGSVAFEFLISFAWVAAILWILASVWAWQLPRVPMID